MATIPEANSNIQALIDAHHESIAEPPRPHMGASTLGHACDRWLWLSFRWAVQPKFPGRILRLFRRGHREEEVIIDDLRAIGLTINKVDSQHRVDFGSHVSGSIDAIIESGTVGAPASRHIAEFKTGSKKMFDTLTKDGVQKAKPEHYVQMQTYMMGAKINRALYLTVCKDDDRLHVERVEFDKDVAQKAVARGQRIALSDRMPEPVNADPATWYQCKYCPAQTFCADTKTTEHINCRTCALSTARPDSTWYCEKWQDTIPLDAQRVACPSHVLHPDLTPWQRKDGPDAHTATYIIDGAVVNNGDATKPNTFSSVEILANPAAVAIAAGGSDTFVDEVRRDMGGRIVLLPDEVPF